jgi:hypothetical protein
MLNEIAWFIGTPGEDELPLIAALGANTELTIIEHAPDVYRHLAHALPSVIVFSSRHYDTTMLRLFRQLRRLEQICVVVRDRTELLAFAGKQYTWRKTMPYHPTSVPRLLAWWANRWNRYQIERREARLLLKAQQSAGIEHSFQPLSRAVGASSAV